MRYVDCESITRRQSENGAKKTESSHQYTSRSRHVNTLKMWLEKVVRPRIAQNGPNFFSKKLKRVKKVSYNNHPRGIVQESNSSEKVSENA